MTNRELQDIWFGAYSFEETGDGWLQAFQYTKAQMEYFRSAFDFWYDRSMATTAKTLEFTTEAETISFEYRFTWTGSQDSFELAVDGLITEIRYVKDLPEHEDDGEASDSESEKDLTGLKELLDGEQFLKVACSANLEGAADAQAMKIFAPLPSSDNRVAIYASGSWKTQIVPNVKSALEAADDGNNIVFGPDGLMTHQTMISMSTSGFGIVAVYRTFDGHLLRKESMDGVTFVEHEDLDDNEKDRRYLLDELKTIMENDDCLLMFQAEFYGFDGLK